MLRKFDVPAKLYLLVSVLSAFILGVAIYGIFQLDQMDRNTQTLFKDRVYPLAQLDEIRFSYASILNTALQCQDQKINTATAITGLQRSQTSIFANWRAYVHTYLTPKEKKLANDAAVAMTRANNRVNQLMAKLKAKDQPAIAADDPLYQQIGAAIYKVNELISLQIAVSKNIYQSSQDSYHTALKQFIILISLLFAFVLPFSTFLVKNIKNLISDLNSANISIKTAEERYRSFIKYAGDAIVVFDSGFAIIDVSDSSCSLLGYTKEELLKMKISDVIVPREEEENVLRLNKIMAGVGSLYERRVVARSGRMIDTELNVRQLEGGLQIAIMRDITEKKSAAKIIKESAAKYKYLFENNPACIIIWDTHDLKVLEVNNVMVEKYGYSKSEFKQMTLLDYRHPHDYEKTRALAKEIQNSDVPILNTQWTHINKNGKEMLMEISSHKIIYNDREAVLSLAMDITDRVSTQAALRKSEEKFYSLIDYAADAIFMVADDGIIFDVNRSGCEMLGYHKAELVGKSVKDLHLPEIREEVPQIWAHLRKTKSFNDERKLLRKDGTAIEVEISRTMLPDASGAIAIVHDITVRKKHLQAIEDQNLRLKEIAWIQSHLVRGPLASILGLVQLCELEDSKNADIIPKLKASADQLDSVIRDITTLTDNLMG